MYDIRLYIGKLGINSISMRDKHTRKLSWYNYCILTHNIHNRRNLILKFTLAVSRLCLNTQSVPTTQSVYSSQYPWQNVLVTKTITNSHSVYIVYYNNIILKAIKVAFLYCHPRRNFET